ncbi:hypothetical protein Tco_0031788 [Tanacetum coccineum]
MALTATNWNFRVHLQVKEALEKDVVSIVNIINARITHFEKDFVKEAFEFFWDYKSIEKEVDESLEKIISEISKQATDVKADLLNRLALLQKDFDKLEAHNVSLEH